MLTTADWQLRITIKAHLKKWQEEGSGLLAHKWAEFSFDVNYNAERCLFQVP